MAVLTLTVLVLVAVIALLAKERQQPVGAGRPSGAETDAVAKRIIPSLPIRSGGGVSGVIDGKIYFIGGWQDLPSSVKLPSSDVFVYNPDHNSWQKSVPSGTRIR